MIYRKVLLAGGLALLGWGAVSPRAATSVRGVPPEPASQPFSVRVSFGHAGPVQERWTGTVTAEDARLILMQGWQFSAQDRVSLNTFDIQTIAPRTKEPLQKGLLLRGSAGAAGRISIAANLGTFSFGIFDFQVGDEKPFLGGNARVTRLLPAEKLSDDSRADDYPSIAVLDDTTAWAVWQSYSGQLDEIRLSKYSKGWRTFTRLPGTSGDVWRPQIALDGRQRPWVVWSQQVEGNFDIYARALDEKTNTWLATTRLSSHPHPDIDHHLINDSQGNLWVVWQGFHGADSDIFLRHYDGSSWSEEIRVTGDPANDWEPRVAVDRRGRAYIVWDTYRNGNYDVYMRTLESGRLGAEIPVADTLKFEAHATVAVDSADRVWVAWDEDRGNWGKDTGMTDDPRWLDNPRESENKWLLEPASPGARLYDTRNLNLVVFAGERRMAPVQGLAAALSQAGIPAHDYPQLLADPRSGRMGLLFHRWSLLGEWAPNLATRQMALWEQAAIFYEGDRWSHVFTMPDSYDRPSARSSAAYAPDGSLWMAWPSDGRLYKSPYQPVADNVYAARIPLQQKAPTPVLAAWNPEKMPPPLTVHSREAQDVTAIRSYRSFVDGVENRIVRGDLHRHTEFSWDNGGLRDGSLFDFYRYILDVAAMDFGAVTDHNAGGDYEYWWWLTEKSCDLFHIPRAYTTFYAYERSVQWPGGHRNVFHTRRGIPIVSFFTTSEYNGPRPGIVGFPARLMKNDTKLLYESLRQTGGISIPHTSASVGGTDWSDNDPEVEPAVEIYQGARVSYEHPGAPRAPRGKNDARDFKEAGFVWNAYRKGYLLGSIASSDHFSTHISYAMVYTEQPTREAIFAAIKQRRTYGATDNIVLDCRMGEHFMGDEFSTSSVPALKVRVIGTAPVSKIEIIKNEKVIYAGNPNTQEVTVTYLDRDVGPGTSYYYVRAVQEDWEMAWGTPIWVHYRP